MEAPTAHRNAPSEHSGVPVGFFSKRPCYGLFFKTLDLQVRFARPPFAHHHALRRAGVPVGLLAAPNARPPGSLRSPSVCAPNQLFKLLRCSAWLIHDFAPSPMRALVFRSAYSASRNARASAAFAASIKAHRALSSETLMLQVRFAHPPPAHRTSSSSCSGVPVGFFSKRPCYGLFSKTLDLQVRFARPPVGRGSFALPLLRTITPCGALVFRSAYWLRQTLDLQVRFAHPPVGGGSFAPPCTPLSCPRKCGDRQAAIPLCGKSSLSEHAMDFPSALHIPRRLGPSCARRPDRRQNVQHPLAPQHPCRPRPLLLSYRSFFFSYFS